MAQIIRSVSINKDQADFLDRNKQLSLSKIAQSKIEELIEASYESEKELRIANSVVFSQEKIIQELNMELDKWKSNGEKKSVI